MIPSWGQSQYQAINGTFLRLRNKEELERLRSHDALEWKMQNCKILPHNHFLYLPIYILITSIYIYKSKNIHTYSHLLCATGWETHKTTAHQLTINMKMGVAEGRNQRLNIIQVLFEVSGI